jgi:hypothetical protein
VDFDSAMVGVAFIAVTFSHYVTPARSLSTPALFPPRAARGDF